MKKPWMPLYVADYLRDTAHLSASEHGAYMLLIMHYWTHNGLPNNEETIRRITRMSPRQWAKSRDLLRSLFLPEWRHRRIDHELAKAIEISSKNSANAKRSHANRIVSRTANAYTLHTSHITVKKEREPKPRKRSPEVALPQGWTPQGADREYAKNNGLTDKEVDLQGKKFANYAQEKGRMARDWSAAWRNWILKFMEYEGRSAPMPPQNGNGHTQGFYASAASLQLEAWDKYRKQTEGKTYPRDHLGGWWFPTEWPPVIRPDETDPFSSGLL